MVVIPGDGDSEGKEANALDERPPELVAVEALHELGHATTSGGGGSDAADWRTHGSFDIPAFLLRPSLTLFTYFREATAPKNNVALCYCWSYWGTSLWQHRSGADFCK